MALPQAARWIKELRASLEAASLYLVPRGGVILWHGSSDAIPKGWAICDGTQGTPDMRDRFVVGAGGKFGNRDRHPERRPQYLDRGGRDGDRDSGDDAGWEYLGMAQPCGQISSTCP